MLLKFSIISSIIKILLKILSNRWCFILKTNIRYNRYNKFDFQKKRNLLEIEVTWGLVISYPEDL